MSSPQSSPEETRPPQATLTGEESGTPLPALTAAEQAAAMVGYRAILRRVDRLIVAVGMAALAASAFFSDWQLSAGLLAGVVLGGLNFRWLAASVDAIGERIVNRHSRERGGTAVLRGIVRIFLMALVAYGIFSCSVRSLVGYLAGLAMPVFALMCEAAYEFVAANRRTS